MHQAMIIFMLIDMIGMTIEGLLLQTLRNLLVQLMQQKFPFSWQCKLVGGYPLSDLIYPLGKSKLFTSRNMMKFWTNFAKTGEPGKSTNSVKWESLVNNGELSNSYIILDNKQNLKMNSEVKTFKSLADELYKDEN